jgi:hypothetical protein
LNKGFKGANQLRSWYIGSVLDLIETERQAIVQVVEDEKDNHGIGGNPEFVLSHLTLRVAKFGINDSNAKAISPI